MSDETTEFDARLKASAEANGVNLEDEQIKALEAQLANAQSVQAEAEAKRERGRRVIVLQEEIAVSERKAREAVVLAELEAKHGLVGKAIAPVDMLDGLIVVKKPDGIKTKYWLEKHAENATQDELRMLARPCVIYPDLATFDAMVTDRPVIVPAVATEVLKLGGLRLKDLGKK